MSSMALRKDRNSFICTFQAGSMGIVVEQFDDCIAVESIAPNSQASKYSSLTIGSILEKVGNVSVEGKSFDSTMDLLKTSPRPLDLTSQ